MPLIKNIKELASNSLRQDALDILEVGYEAVLTEQVVAKNISLKKGILKIKNNKYNLIKYKRVFLIAVGKCANRSATILEKILGDKITGGVVLDVEPVVYPRFILQPWDSCSCCFRLPYLAKTK